MICFTAIVVTKFCLGSVGVLTNCKNRRKNRWKFSFYLADFTSRLSVLQAVIICWGRSARWRQSRFAWFFMEWIGVQIKGNECSTWNNACRITTHSHTCSPIPTLRTKPTASAKPGKFRGFLRPIAPVFPQFAGFSRLFTRFFVELAGFGTNK